MEKHSTFKVTTKNGVVIAEIAIAGHLGTFVAHALAEYCELYVDHDNLLDDYKPASWYVTVEGDIGVPVWRRLGIDDAYRRATMHADRLASEQNTQTFASLASLNRSVRARIVNASLPPPRGPR